MPSWSISYDLVTGTPGGHNLPNRTYGNIVVPLTTAERLQLYRDITGPLTARRFLSDQKSFKTKRHPATRHQARAVRAAFRVNNNIEVVPRLVNLKAFTIYPRDEWTNYATRRTPAIPP